MDLFYSNFNKDDKLITINQIDSKHITKSFRKNIGDLIKITNGNGSICDAKIIEKGRNIKVEIKKTAIGGIITPENDNPIDAYPSAVPIFSLNQFAINFEVLRLPKITIPNAITTPYTSKNWKNVCVIESKIKPNPNIKAPIVKTFFIGNLSRIYPKSGE